MTTAMTRALRLPVNKLPHYRLAVPKPRTRRADHVIPLSLNSSNTFLSLFSPSSNTTLPNHATYTSMPLVTSDQATEISLKQDGIIPDVIDSFQSKTLLVLSYGNGKDVALGNRLAVAGITQWRQPSSVHSNASLFLGRWRHAHATHNIPMRS